MGQDIKPSKENGGKSKFEIVFEDEISKSVWKYDYSITQRGPVSVTITHKDVSNWGKKMTLSDWAKLDRKKSK